MNAIALCAAALLIGAAVSVQKPVEHGAAAPDGIPSALVAEHRQLHAELDEAARAGGRTGEAGVALQRLMQPHFEAEEEYALPQLGALVPLATGQRVADADRIAQLSMKLKSDLPKMLEEHKAIGAAADRLLAAAKAEGKTAPAAFAVSLKHHALMEEQVMYPAAILVGEWLKTKSSDLPFLP